MKKILAVALIAVVLGGSVAPALAANEQRGGLMGLVAGCCFGVRSAAAYNDGKDIHWKEWLQLIGVGYILAGLDGMGGKTTAELAKQYGSNFY